MIDLRDSTVLVNNVKEYRVITKIAKKQGFRWASGDSLNRICCHFPTRLEFNRRYETYWNSRRGRCARDYPKCMALVGGVRSLIMIRGEDLTNIFCDFPTRLRFNEECKVYYNSSAYFYNRDYKCKEIVGALRNMILKRKEGQLC